MGRDLKHLILLAKDNNAEAINELGYAYFAGEDIKQDFQKAYNYYLRAADLGLGIAQYNLGLLYAEGKGVEQDGEQAARYYLLAAEQNVLAAQYNLAFLLHEGKIIPQDLDQAFYWYQRAAEANQPNAQHNLGCMYFFGEGVVQNDKTAEEFFIKAANKVPESNRMLGEVYRKQGNDDKAFDYFRMAGEAGDVKAIFMLGLFLSSGPENRRDIKRAAELFAIAIKGNHPQAKEFLERLAKENTEAKEVYDDYLKDVSANK